MTLWHLLAFSPLLCVWQLWLGAGDQNRPLSVTCRAVVPGDLEEKKRSLPGEFCREEE